jgi:hypothetical protein
MDGAELVADKDAALARLSERAPAPTIVMEQADVSGALVPRPSDAFVPCQARVGGEAVSVSVDAPGPGFVLVNEVYYPGWVASVDGAPAPIRRANALMRAVWVPAGHHDIAMEFRPWQPRVLEPLAWGGLIALLAGLRRRSGGHRGPPTPAG